MYYDTDKGLNSISCLELYIEGKIVPCSNVLAW
jgi:hypothetical protein